MTAEKEQDWYEGRAKAENAAFMETIGAFNKDPVGTLKAMR